MMSNLLYNYRHAVEHLYMAKGPDTRNYLRIPCLMEIEFSSDGAAK